MGREETTAASDAECPTRIYQDQDILGLDIGTS